MSTPSSVIHIIAGVPINNSYEHTLYFDTKAEQTSYFMGKKVKTFDKFTYLRPGNVIKVAGDVANARNWNYLMFQNDTGKWYYHFINKVVYLNDSAVELHIELDVIQTYRFDWELLPCFIERMHTPTDEFGEHTIPEGLETGPLIRHSSHEINLEDNVILGLIADNDGSHGKMYGGVYSALRVFAVNPTTANLEKFNEWLDGVNTAGNIDSLVSMWVYPKALVNIAEDWDENPVLHDVLSANDTIRKAITDDLADATDIDGYPVKNKKTFCYPYTMLYVSNNMGSCAVYHRERFHKYVGDYMFRIYGALSPDSGVQLVPQGYKTAGATELNFEEGLSLPAFPTCAWVSDTYKVWLAQNQNQQELATNQAYLKAGVGVASFLGTALTGNLMGVVGGVSSLYSAFSDVQSLMAQKEDMAIQPDQARGNHSANINLTHGRNGFSACFMTITGEYAKSIDQYFTRYGYKVNTIETPNLHTRSRFTFIKTAGAMVTGDLGAEDQLKIQGIFDKGVTFWVDKEHVGNYTADNNTL